MRRFALCSVLLLALAHLQGCEDEAMMHPPIPPSTTIPELGAASQPTTQPASAPTATGSKAPEMTMAQFMSDKIEPATRKALASKKPDPALDHWLKVLIAVAPSDAKFKAWDAITQNSMKPGRYAQGCRQCHAAYLRPYKKKYHEVTFPVPADTYP